MSWNRIGENSFERHDGARALHMVGRKGWIGVRSNAAPLTTVEGTLAVFPTPAAAMQVLDAAPRPSP